MSFLEGSPEDRRERRARKARRRRAYGFGILRTFAIVLGFLTFVIFILSGIQVHFTAKTGLEEELKRRLIAVASLVARDIPPGYAQLLTAEKPNPMARGQVADICSRAQVASSVRGIVVIDPEQRILATNDTRPNAAIVADDTVVQAIASHKATIERAVRARAAECTPLYPLRDRNYKSCYAPVLLDKKVVLLVGVDYPTDFDEELDAVDRSFLGLGAASFLAVLACAVMLVRQRVRVPIDRLVRAMEGGEDAVKPGLPVRARIRWRDEIGVLTEHYNHMVDRLGAQEAELRDLYKAARTRAEFLTGYSKYLVEELPTAVVAVAPDGSITVWNEASQRILGKGPILGQHVSVALEPESPVARALLAALRGEVTDQALVGLGMGNERSLTESAETQDETGPSSNRLRLVELTAGPFKNPETGAILGAVALVHDRTELENLRRAAARNERLAALGHLGGQLAHEIRNPLNAISGFAELIEKKKGSEDAARLTRRLRDEVDTLNRFVTEFLLFARDPKIRRAPTDLNELLKPVAETALQSGGFSPEETRRLLDGEAVARPAGEMKVILDPWTAPVVANVDAPQLKAALVNIAKNAVEAMGGKGALKLRATLERGDRGVIRIRDTGPGVPHDLREKIFDPFFTTRETGTGLGLAIAHKIVVAGHRGKIAVRDPSDGGCEFVVSVPLVAISGEGPPVVEDDATPHGSVKTSDVQTHNDSGPISKIPPGSPPDVRQS